MTGTEQAANWYPDPMGRHEYRYWDGANWTEHVSSHGRQSTDPLTQPPKTVAGQQGAASVQDQVGRHIRQAEKRGAPTGQFGSTAGSTAGDAMAGDAAPPTGGGLLDQPVLVVNQRWKLIEVNTEFAIYDPNGAQIGAVRQVGQSAIKKVIRFFGSLDQYFTHKYQVVDHTGQPQLLITRPAKFVKSRVIVQDGLGNEIGEIVQQNVFGKIRFAFMVDGQEVGGIFAENWRPGTSPSRTNTAPRWPVSRRRSRGS